MHSKPVDSTQVVLDNRGKKANARMGTLAGVTGSAGMNGFVFKLLAVLFVVGNVTALYVLHFVNRPSPTTRFSLTSFTATSGTSASVGDVVSLSSDSTLRNGAGTTAYLDRHTLAVAGASSYYEYINMAPLGVTASSYLTNLMSYRQVTATGKQSVLTTFTVDPVTKGVSISTGYDATKNVVTADAIRGIATLSDTQALVMTVDDSTFNYKTYLMPAAISSSSGATLNQANKVLVATGSITSFVTRLTSTSALVAYYDPYVASTSYYQNVKIVTVASDGTVALSAATQFGPDNNVAFANWGKPVVVSATSGSIVIPYYVGTTSGVCVIMSAFVSSSNTMGAFSTPVCNTNFQPTFFIDGVMLSDKVLLLAFHDKAKNNALALVTVAITSATTAYFRSAYVFPEVAGDFDYGTQYGFSPELSLALLSGNRVAVSFLNPSMNGRQSIKVLQYSTESLAFKDVTPVVPLAPATFTLNLNGGTLDRAVTQKILGVGSDSVVAMHMGARGAMAHQHVALVESFGAPVGLLRDYNGKRDASVAISGTASEVSTKDNAKMVVGQFYYATTAGYVVTPDATTPAGTEYFAASEDAKVLVTANSKVGVAIEKDTLFVSTAL